MVLIQRHNDVRSRWWHIVSQTNLPYNVQVFIEPEDIKIMLIQVNTNSAVYAQFGIKNTLTPWHQLDSAIWGNTISYWNFTRVNEFDVHIKRLPNVCNPISAIKTSSLAGPVDHHHPPPPSRPTASNHQTQLRQLLLQMQTDRAVPAIMTTWNRGFQLVFYVRSYKPVAICMVFFQCNICLKLP